jgi:hypothetical protein
MIRLGNLVLALFAGAGTAFATGQTNQCVCQVVQIALMKQSADGSRTTSHRFDCVAPPVEDRFRQIRLGKFLLVDCQVPRFCRSVNFLSSPNF